MGTTKFLIDDIDWPEGIGGPAAVVVALPDWLVLSDMPRGENALADWQREWDDLVAEKVEELVGTRPESFGYSPADHDDEIGVVGDDDHLHDPLAGEHEK